MTELHWSFPIIPDLDDLELDDPDFQINRTIKGNYTRPVPSEVDAWVYLLRWCGSKTEGKLE